MAHLIRGLSKRLPKVKKVETAPSTDLFEEELSSLVLETGFDDTLTSIDDKFDDLGYMEKPPALRSYTIDEIVKGKFNLLQKKEESALHTDIRHTESPQDKLPSDQRRIGKIDFDGIMKYLNPNEEKSNTNTTENDSRNGQRSKTPQQIQKEIIEMKNKQTAENVIKQLRSIRAESEGQSSRYYVTENTPPASSPSEIKGILAAAHFAMINNRKRLSVFRGKFFSCDYFPPEHALGCFRKSKPALRVHYLEGFTANNPHIKIDKNQLSRSLTPRDYASLRCKWRKLLREEFFHQYTKAGGRDGYYAFAVSIFPKPEDMNLFRKELRICIENAMRAQTTPFIKAANSLVDWGKVCHFLNVNGIPLRDPPIGVKSSRGPPKRITAEQIDTIMDAFNDSKRQL